MSLIIIDKTRLQEVIEKAVTFDADREVEMDIKELKEAYDLLNAAMEEVKSSYKKQFNEFSSKSVEGSLVRVQTYQSGAKYLLADEQIVDPQFLKVQLDSDSVEAYMNSKDNKEHQLPAGVNYKKRSVTVRITLKETENV